MRTKNGNSGNGDSPSNPEDQARRRYHATRCGWTTNGRGCLLTGTRSPDVGGITHQDGTTKPPKGFCAYHADRLGAGQGAGDSREFGEWLEHYRACFPPACYGHSEFTRYMPETLWEAATGSETLPVRSKPAPPDNRPASPRERSQRFAEAMNKLRGMGR